MNSYSPLMNLYLPFMNLYPRLMNLYQPLMNLYSHLMNLYLRNSWRNFLRRFYEAFSVFAKLLSPYRASQSSRALRSLTWLRKLTQEVALSGLITNYINATSCVDFAKPCLASRSSRALWSQIWLRKSTQEVALSGLITGYIDATSCVDFFTQLLASILRSLVWLRKALEPVGLRKAQELCEAWHGFANWRKKLRWVV